MKPTPKKDKLPGYVNQRRRALADFIQRYLDARPASKPVGEFLDDEGCRDDQFGLGGISFTLALKQRHKLDGEVLRKTETTVLSGLQKNRDSRNKEEAHLLKDVPRVPTKASLLALWLTDNQLLFPVLDDIFANSAAEGLLRPISDMAEKRGDVSATAYVLQILYLSNRNHHKTYEAKIMPLLEIIEKELHESQNHLIKKLYLSTTLCMYSYEANIDYHRKLLVELYKDESDWYRAFANNSPFIETWFADTGQGKAETRYLKVPTGYIILSAIYVAFGDEDEYFRFSAVKKMLSQISVSFRDQVALDRSKSAIYNIFFLMVSLHPSTYISVPKSSLLQRYIQKGRYLQSNLTKIGMAVVLLTLLGGTATTYYTILVAGDLLTKQTFTNLPDWLRAAGMTLSGALGLMRTYKR